MKDILFEIRVRKAMIEEKGYEPLGLMLHPSRKDELLEAYYPHTDWTAVKLDYTNHPVVYGMIVHFDYGLRKDDILIAYDPSPPLECQVEDPDNDPDILDARHVYFTVELAEKAGSIIAGTCVVDWEQMERIYSPDVFKPFYCEYCRKRVSRYHRCEKGVR